MEDHFYHHRDQHPAVRQHSRVWCKNPSGSLQPTAHQGLSCPCLHIGSISPLPSAAPLHWNFSCHLCLSSRRNPIRVYSQAAHPLFFLCLLVALLHILVCISYTSPAVTSSWAQAHVLCSRTKIKRHVLDHSLYPPEY